MNHFHNKFRRKTMFNHHLQTVCYHKPSYCLFIFIFCSVTAGIIILILLIVVVVKVSRKYWHFTWLKSNRVHPEYTVCDKLKRSILNTIKEIKINHRAISTHHKHGNLSNGNFSMRFQAIVKFYNFSFLPIFFFLNIL